MQRELTLNELSPIGFGAYHTGLQEPEHREALLHALQKGCNLIDTSSNYENGDSERLVGEVLAQSGLPAFVISKVGYIQGRNLEVLAELNAAGKAKDDLVDISDELKHSIHPEFLGQQLEQSLERLQRPRLDAWLLHNPEYFFRLSEDQEVYYQRIAKALAFMEQMVSAGKIRYYGISSNTFIRPEGDPQQSNLPRIMELAHKVSENHHFRFIQFPYNLTENFATKVDHAEGKSLLEWAQSYGLRTLINRPLNARVGDSFLRIATYPEQSLGLNPEKDGIHWQNLRKMVEERFQELGIEDDPMDMEVMSHLEANWMQFGNDSAIRHVVYGYLMPFLNYIYQEDIPETTLKTVEQLSETMDRYSRKMMSDKVTKFIKQWEKTGYLQTGDERPLPVRAAASYLDSGFDHVLMGMRKKKYVEEMQDLFKP